MVSALSIQDRSDVHGVDKTPRPLPGAPANLFFGLLSAPGAFTAPPKASALFWCARVRDGLYGELCASDGVCGQPCAVHSARKRDPALVYVSSIIASRLAAIFASRSYGSLSSAWTSRTDFGPFWRFLPFRATLAFPSGVLGPVENCHG